VRRVRRITLGIAATVAALSVATPAIPADAAVGAQGTNQKCPLGALKKAKEPVEIRFWHFTNSANTEAIERLTKQFNSSQSAVHVTAIVQPTYDDVIDKYVAGLTTGDLPDVAMIEDARLQQMIDTQSILPIGACAKADHYDLSDTLERATDYYTVQGTLWPMPFNVSAPVLYYNKKAFRAAGLDPDKPPTTLDEVQAAAKKLKDTGAVKQAGYALRLEPGTFEQFTAKAGKPYVNNGNGRNARATKTTFDTKVGRDVFTWMNDMVSSGLAITNESNGPSAFDNLVAIGSGDAAMSIDTSAALGTVTQLLSSGQYPNVEIGVAPMPGPPGSGGVVVDGAALYISNKSSPAKQAAAWEFLKFLNSPEVQADWAASTGYVPLRKSATDLPVIKTLWAQHPEYKVAYDELVTGPNNTATAGPVIGDYKGVHDAVLEAWQSMLTQGTKPKTALKQAKHDADAAIAEYNSRVGG
jgi:sn-glycerol 3-phosphate transport system substrate-binding protein